MKSTATFFVERCDAWGAERGASGQVAEAVRGALREAVVAFAEGACRVPGACDAKLACAACGLFGAPGRPGRVSVAAEFDARAGAVSVAIEGGDGDVARVLGAANALRKLTLGGRTWRVRDVEVACSGNEGQDSPRRHGATEDFGEDRRAEAGADAEAADVWVRLAAMSPWLVADFTWGDGFRAGAAAVVPGSHLRGALRVEGGRVSHLRLVSEARARVVVRRGAEGVRFAEEAWEAGAVFEGRITGGKFDAVSEGAIGAGRNRGCGRFRATYRAVAEGDEPPALLDAEASRVTVEFATDAALASRADLGRELFGEGGATLRGALIARGPTGAPLSWVRGRPAIPAGSQFDFQLNEGDRDRAFASLRRVLKTGVGEGASDGYGELRLLEMKR
jgi:hypothetical protein